MFKSKSKGLYVDISEFSILAARTSGYKSPITVEEIAEYPLTAGNDPDDVRAFLEGLVDFKGSDFFVSRAAVYPEGRFIRYYEAETVSKVRDSKFLSGVVQKEFHVDVDASVISILNAKDGSDLDLEKATTKQLIFCGAPKANFADSQSYLLKCGLYPQRMELSTMTTVGGVIDYAKFKSLTGPILCFELTSSSANVSIISGGQIDVARPVPFGMDSIYPLLQRELGLKDESSAKKLFFSNTFDFAEMGPKLLRRLTKELQATTGFYEVQTGQTIEHVFLSVLPKNLNWVAQTVSESLGLKIISPQFEPWLERLNIKLADDVETANLGSRWLGLFSQMADFNSNEGAISD